MKIWTEIVALLAIILLTPMVAAADDAEGKQAWMEAMTPGAQHTDLADQAGEWRYVVSIWNEPNAEPTKLKGVAVKTMMLGGRYLKEELNGEFMDRPFQGFGITGYDNVTQQYVSIWIDNMGTGIHFYTGHEERDGSHVYESESHDPATRKPIATRSVGKVIDRDHHTFESYVKQSDGSEVLHMRVEYTRATN